MISGNFLQCNDLMEFYETIRKLHEKAHGKDYCAVHDEINSRVTDKKYIELGVNQGGTLAGALLQKPHTVYGVDRNIDYIEPYRQLMISFADENKIDFRIKRGTSTNKKIIEECDILYIDTTHKWPTLKSELNAWNSIVNETIIIHDTHNCRLQSRINKWVEDNPIWKVTHNTQNVGYSILERA